MYHAKKRGVSKKRKSAERAETPPLPFNNEEERLAQMDEQWDSIDAWLAAHEASELQALGLEEAADNDLVIDTINAFCRLGTDIKADAVANSNEAIEKLNSGCSYTISQVVKHFFKTARASDIINTTDDTSTLDFFHGQTPAGPAKLQLYKQMQQFNKNFQDEHANPDTNPQVRSTGSSVFNFYFEQQGFDQQNTAMLNTTIEPSLLFLPNCDCSACSFYNTDRTRRESRSLSREHPPAKIEATLKGRVSPAVAATPTHTHQPSHENDENAKILADEKAETDSRKRDAKPAKELPTKRTKSTVSVKTKTHVAAKVIQPTEDDFAVQSSSTSNQAAQYSSYAEAAMPPWATTKGSKLARLEPKLTDATTILKKRSPSEEMNDGIFKLAAFVSEFEALALRQALDFRVENEVFVLMLSSEMGDQWFSRLMMLRDEHSTIRLAEFTGCQEEYSENVEHWLKADYAGPEQLMEAINIKCIEYFQQS